MNDNLTLVINAAIDKVKSQKEINIQLKEIQQSAQAKADSLELGVKINTKDIKSAMLQVNKEIKSYSNVNLELDKTKLSSNIQNYMNTNVKATKAFGGELTNIQSQIKNADKEELSNLTKQFQSTTAKARELGLAGDTVFQAWKKNMASFTSFLSAGAVLMGFINTLKGINNTVIELDKSLTDLAIASNGSYESTYKLLMSYNKLGKELGATTAQVSASADGFLRQGKSIQETEMLVRDSIMLSKLGQIESAEATQYLTSATKGYNVAAKDAINIVDKLTAVDAKSATSAGGLALGMSRVANMAKLSGISMDKLLGYLATVGEVTQKEMSEVGNSFKLGTVTV